jgi:spermidine synthase
MILYLLLFLSGAAALLFETLWFRLAAVVFGNTVWASSIVLASFMAGLAAGNWGATRYGGRLRRPIRAYAVLEVAVALGGLALVLVLPRLASVLAPLFHRLLDHPALLQAVRVAVAFALLVVPSAAMGGTLPVVVKALTGRGATFGTALGALYGCNTFGALLGALGGEGYLIGRFGMTGTGAVAAVLDLLAAALAWRLSTAVEGAGDAGAGAHAPPPAADTPSVRPLLAVLGAAALAGGLLLALEVVWFRLLTHFVGAPSSLAFAVMLAVVLAGIAAGGWIAAVWLRLDPQAWENAPAVALAAGAATLAAYAWPDRVMGAAWAYSLSGTAVTASCLTFPTSLLSGVLFTLVGRGLRRDVADDSQAVGWLTLANTLGATAGALLGGFVLLPRAGIEGSIRGLGAAYAAVALLLLAASRPASARGRALAAAGAGLLGIALLRFPAGLMEHAYRTRILARWATPNTKPIAWREGLTETLLYTRYALFDVPISHRLLTNGFSMAGTDAGSRRYMKAYVYWPVAFHPAPRRALLISFGLGSTAAALTDTRELTSIDVVDISRDVLEMGRLIVPAGRTYPLDDPRVRVHVEDGRFFLLTTDREFDIITGEPPPPKYAGVVNLYTREYFELVRRRLAPGGMTTYWLPVFELDATETRAIVGAFCAAFQDCSLWNGAGLNWMLVGSRGATYSPGAERLQRQWGDPSVAPELAAVGFESPAALAATYIADAPFLVDWARGVGPLEDDFPHRLRPLPTADDEAARQHAPIMDAAAARTRFLASPWPARLGSEALAAQAAAAFDFQGIFNRDELRRLTQDFRGSWRDTAEALRHAPPWVTLRVLGPEPGEVGAAAAAQARGLQSPSISYLLAMRAAAGGEHETAQALLRDVGAGSPISRRAAQQRALLLCLLGRPDEAREVVRALGPVEADFGGWMATSCQKKL